MIDLHSFHRFSFNSSMLLINTGNLGGFLPFTKANQDINFGQDQLGKKIQNLYATDDGEPSKESHGASHETQLALELDLLVSLYLVV